MNIVPSGIYWRAEGLKLSRQPLAWVALALLFLLLLVAAVSAGLDAAAWRKAAAEDTASHAVRLESAVEPFRKGLAAGPARAVATYQLGRGDLGQTRMPVAAGLALGVQRLELLPVRLKASLESRHVDARDPAPLRNGMLADAALPGLPAMVALLLPLVALVLCSGLLQEEREQGRLTLLRLQSRRGLRPIMVAALGWRWLALWLVAVTASLPAFMLDPGAGAGVVLQWSAGLAAFCAWWVLVGGLLSWAPLSGASSMLAALGLWVALTFAVPAGLVELARSQAPMPSRLASIVAIRDAQQESEEHESELALAWYAGHPEILATQPAVWPASFVARVLHQDRLLQPLAVGFRNARTAQASFVTRWSWLSPGLSLVLFGQRMAGTDTASHTAYLNQVEAFEERWRQYLVLRVMDIKGMSQKQFEALPRF